MAAAKVPYAKPSLDVRAQVDLLAARGLIITDRALATHHLSYIGYYRLSGYCQALRVDVSSPDDLRLAPGVTFEHVLALYQFDRQIRALLSDALERIEVAVKSSIS